MADAQSTPALVLKQDLSGRRFGRLVVASVVGRSADRRVLWQCRCDCGGLLVVASTALTTGRRTSCGCLQKEIVARRNRDTAIRNGEPPIDPASLFQQLKATFGVAGSLALCSLSGGYVVSDDGRVFSTRTGAPIELSRRVDSAGYYHTVNIRRAGRAANIKVHRLVAAAFLGPSPFPKAHVRHLDGDPLNNHVSNLAWGSASDNMQDMVRHGRTLRGTRSPHAKLTDDKVREILALRGKMGQKRIARQFGVSRTLVKQILAGEGWPGVQRLAGLPPLPAEANP